MDKFRYHRDGEQPRNDEIFVFGSNESGIHGAGAARAAKERFGARYGVGFGLMGQSFAIPTKDWTVTTLPLDAIRFYVDRFAAFTNHSSNSECYVTRIGCGLSGHVDANIAPLFKKCNSNCIFPEQWKQFLES